MYNFTFRSNASKVNADGPSTSTQDNLTEDIIISMVKLTSVSKKKLLHLIYCHIIN